MPIHRMNSGTSVIFGRANSASIGPMISRATVREAPAASPTGDADCAADDHAGSNRCQRGERVAGQACRPAARYGLGEDRRGPAPEQVVQNPVGRELPAKHHRQHDRRLCGEDLPELERLRAAVHQALPVSSPARRADPRCEIKILVAALAAEDVAVLGHAGRRSSR